MWLGLWRADAFELRSLLTPDAVLDRLRQCGVPDRPRWIDAPAGTADRVIRGWANDDEVVLYMVRTNVRNSWQRVLRANFVHTDDGCVLVGSISTRPIVRTFSALWLGFAGLSVVVLLVSAVTTLTAGHWSAVPGRLGFVGFVVALGGAGAALMTLGGFMSRGDERALTAWLKDLLTG